MSKVKRYYIGRNRDHEKVMTEITDNDKRFIKIPDDEWVRATDYDSLENFVTRSNNAMREAMGDDLWSMGHPAYVVVHLRQELEKVSRLWKEASARAEISWVIEGGWTSIDKPDYWVGSSAWSEDPLRALRFARRQDAQQAADLMLAGVNVRICEHEWMPPRRVLVCGVDCHPGDANCNNYCNRAPQKGPMAAAELDAEGRDAGGGVAGYLRPNPSNET